MVQGKIFEKLFKLTEIKRLKGKDIEKYRKSILEYHDVRLAVDYALEKGKIDIIQKSLQMNIPIEVIVELTGYSKEQINRFKDNDTLM